jgi:hypothetical protein
LRYDYQNVLYSFDDKLADMQPLISL